MGFPENQKLAKDINKVNDECAERLVSRVKSISDKINSVNTIFDEIGALDAKTLYRPSIRKKNVIAGFEDSTGTSVSKYPNATFVAGYDGEVTLYAEYAWGDKSGQVAYFGVYDSNNKRVFIEYCSTESSKGQGIFYKNFPVNQGATYEFRAGLFSDGAEPTTAKVSIRGVVQHCGGTK